MRDLLSWNLSLGRWAGVQVRLHLFFIAFAFLAIYYAAMPPGNLLWYGVSCVVILLVSVLLHEFGHCFVAWKVGGNPDQILVWPFGGLIHAHAGHEPQNELASAMAGPVVNLILFGFTAPIVWASSGNLAALLNPLNPPVPAAAGMTWRTVAEVTCWLNWLLVVVNLLPACQLDATRVLRAILWHRVNHRMTVLIASRVAQATAVGLWLSAWLVSKSYPYAVLPLVMFGMLAFFSARQEADRALEQDSDDAEFGYDFSQGYASLEASTGERARRGPGLIAQWLANRREARRQRAQQVEAEEERRADEVLARLHATGLESLSAADRALLGRVSQRYRNRPRS